MEGPWLSQILVAKNFGVVNSKGGNLLLSYLLIGFIFMGPQLVSKSIFDSKQFDEVCVDG